jgi:hypothetical protein
MASHWRMTVDVAKFNSQQNKSELTQPTSLLQSLPILEQKWESISMDFITELPKVQSRDYIYVAVDKLTKFAYFFSIPSKYSDLRWRAYSSGRCLDYMVFQDT